MYDQRPEPPSPSDDREWRQIGKHYLIGLGGRGITALEEFGVWDDVAAFSTLVPGRKEWTSSKKLDEGVETMLTDQRKYATHVLARDRLVSVLHKYILDNYDNEIQMHWDHEVRPFSFGDDEVIVEIADKKKNHDNDDTKDTTSWTRVSSHFVVAADGSARSFANRMEEDDNKENVEANQSFHVIRYEDDNPRVFKSIPFQLPTDWRKDINYAVRSEDSRIIFDALPANRVGDYIGTLLLRDTDVMAQANVDPKQFKEFLDEYLPQFSSLFGNDVIVKVATDPASYLPTFRYVTPRLQHKQRTVLLGDCAHTVKPYFGMGANSALEDIKVSVLH